MASSFAHSREAVRVKVRKCEANLPNEWRKFSVDPQITSLEVLYSLLAKAFDIKSDFSIKYKAFDPAGNEIYLAVLSDWDLDAAFLRIHNLAIQTTTEPCLLLQIDIKPFTEVREWESSPESSRTSVRHSGSGGGAGSGSEASTALSPTYAHASAAAVGARELAFGVSQKYVQHMQTKLPGLIMNQMEKTFSIVQKAFNLSEETMATLPPRAPISDAEFRLFLDALGHIQRCDELRKVIFFGGIDPSLRRVVWKHILNVYPGGMSGHQRMNYMRRKAEQYQGLRDTWKAAVKQGCVVGELSYVTSMVKKDVLRTDRLHPFYAGSDDNQNIASLFNILTTYALNHPAVSYCQGMSDIASPLLVTMNDEAHAYICFCAIMARVRGNFMLDGLAMTQKFAHLTEALSFYDPEFWDYLKLQQADDLLFCYRWLLLELKREFPFEDALRMLEVQWSSLKYETATDRELSLFEKEFVPIMESSAPTTSSSLSGGGSSVEPISPSYLMVINKPRDNAYIKVCDIRRQSSSASLTSLSSSVSGAADTSRLNATKRMNHSLDDNISRLAGRKQRNASVKSYQSLDETKTSMLTANVGGGGGGGNDKPTQNTAAAQEEQQAEDDDVFGNAPINSAISRFIFHPTNPFIDDAAQMNCNEMPCADLKDDKSAPAPAKAFLNSTSSSIADNEIEIAEAATTTTTTAATVTAKTSPAKSKALSGKLQNRTYNAVSNIIAKQLANASSVGDSVKRVGSGSGGHFKDLKEKIAATSRKGISFDDPNSDNPKTQPKLVKNLNEFLHFASVNTNRITDKFATTATTTTPPNKAPAIKTNINDKDAIKTPSSPPALLRQISVDSDSSSVPDTTWSGSTAATAIQQNQNLSSYSLDQHLASLATTPECVQERSDAEAAAAAEQQNASADNSADMEQFYPMTCAKARELRLDSDNLDRQLFGGIGVVGKTSAADDCTASDGSDIQYKQLNRDLLDLFEEELRENEIRASPNVSLLKERRRCKREADEKAQQQELNRINASSNNAEIAEKSIHSLAAAPNLKSNPFIDAPTPLTKRQTPPSPGPMPHSSSLPEVLLPISSALPPPPSSLSATLGTVELATNASDEIAFARPSPQRRGSSGGGGSGGGAQMNSTSRPPTPPILPPPAEFGGGNPFLIFLCLTLLLQHRNDIMKRQLDYNEIAMHFDKMVRKHDVTRVLNQARRMYIDYLKVQNAYSQRQAAAANAASDGDLPLPQ